MINVDHTNIEMNNTNMQLIIDIFGRCKKEDKYNLIDADKILQLYTPQNGIDFDIALAYYALFKNIDCILDKHIYSYTLIHNKLKELITNFDANSYKKLGVCIKLLDNPILVYKNLFTIVSQINTYYKKDIDQNFINCCLVIKSVVIYDRRLFEDKREYLKSFLCYLIDKLEDIHSLYESKVVCTTIKHAMKILEVKHAKDFLFGKYQTLENKISTFIDIKNDNLGFIQIYEEQLLLANLFYVMHKILVLLHDNGVYTNTPLLPILKLQIVENKRYKIQEWSKLQTYYYKSKYLLLDKLIKMDGYIDTRLFVQDISCCSDKYKVVAKLTEIVFNIDMSMIYDICAAFLQDMAVFICKLFEKCKFSKDEHEFFCSLIRNTKDAKTLALFIHYSKKYNTCFCSYKIEIFTLFFEQSLYKPKLDKNVDLVIEYILKQNKQIITSFVRQISRIDFVDLKILYFLYRAAIEERSKSIISYCEKYTNSSNLYIIFYITLIRMKLGKYAVIKTYTDLIISLIISIDSKQSYYMQEIDSSIPSIVFTISTKQYKTLKDLYLLYKGKTHKSKIYDQFIIFKQTQTHKKN
ncbi:hypothetical protein BDAP_002498 [Binucleata daphniae]